MVFPKSPSLVTPKRRENQQPLPTQKPQTETLQPLPLKFITLVIAKKRVRLKTADMQGPGM